jgi:hypothetical protein
LADLNAQSIELRNQVKYNLFLRSFHSIGCFLSGLSGFVIISSWHLLTEDAKSVLSQANNARRHVRSPQQECARHAVCGSEV